MVKIIKRLNEMEANDVHYCGNKANYLWVMLNQGITIPETLVVSYPKEWKVETNIEHALKQMADYIGKCFLGVSEFMIRSSFENEDSKDSSMAGKFKTIHINDKTEIMNAIREVWDSAGEDWDKMGIVIQPYINAQYSGILFSSSPFDSEKDVMIEFAETSCDRLVKGNITPDLFIGNQGWIYKKPDYVSDIIMSELFNIVKILKHELKCDIDLEFCVANDQLYLLQCRPITTGNWTRPVYVGSSSNGEWVLQEELPYPFSPLIRTLDPSGIFATRPHLFFKNYVYFKSYCMLKINQYDKWENWGEIQKYYMDEFTDILQKCTNADIHMLEHAVKIYRDLVRVYMNINWFKYRRKCYNDLIEAIKIRHDDYNKIFFDVMRSIKTINTEKRKDFMLLIREEDQETSQMLKEQFIRKYGFETSHPFYILSKSLTDYIDEIIHIAKEKKISEISWTDDMPMSYYYDVYDEELCMLIDKYREVVQRTEDDDYLLCLGSYTIRCILNIIESKLLLDKEDIYFYEYDELKKIIRREKTICSNSIIKKRKAFFQVCKKYDMPSIIKDGTCLYVQTKPETTIIGTTVSSGKARGAIYVLQNPGDIFEIINIPNGSIIYCSWISPVLSSYFFNIRGIILSEESILSHGAILAREMGIPAIGGINYDFKNGMMIELDGTDGKVYFEKMEG